MTHDITASKSISLLKEMLTIRMVEEAIASNYLNEEMRCPVHLSIGQEAAAVGVCQALKKTDQAVSTHRAHAHYLAKGGNLRRMIAEIYGKESGCSKGMGGSMHLIDRSVGFEGSTAIVGNTIPVGVGLALANKIDKKNSIVAIFLGDGATEEGAFFESVNFAATKKLQVLFICENNLYSVYSPLKYRQPKDRSIYKMAESMSIMSSKVDGNNIEAVYSETKNAIKKIKSTSTPYLVELDTYRWREHCGPNYDNHIGYRAESEFLNWKKRDPVMLFEKTLIDRGIFDSKTKKDLIKSIKRKVSTAFDFAKKSKFPKPEKAFSGLYA